MNHTDTLHILRLFEDGDRALMAADKAELQRIYADDYIQYDDSGRMSTKQDLIRNLTSAAIRFLSMRSTGRELRLLSGNIAIVHGSEEDEIEQGGIRYRVNYLYLDVVMKRKGAWQIVASQLAKRAGPQESAS